jgi:Kef-type K+ transport system membrane component KefB
MNESATAAARRFTYVRHVLLAVGGIIVVALLGRFAAQRVPLELSSIAAFFLAFVLAGCSIWLLARRISRKARQRGA